jgi:YegS/Rv2252/BmrU family lipid kinase
MVSKDAWLAIVNPASGRARAGAQWPQMADAFARAGVPVDVIHTSRPNEGETIARQAVQNGRRRLLAAGGDGSVNDVVNGIMTAGCAPHDHVTLAPVPLGTGNDWARSLGIPRDPAGIAAIIAAEVSFLHDVGHIEFPAAGHESARGRWFINVAGAGYDSHVIQRLPQQLPSPFAYLRGALTGLATYRAPVFRITTEGGSLEERLLLAFVANGQYCGNRMHVAPNARLDDGLLDVVAIRNVGLLTVLVKVIKLYRGTLLDDPVVWHARGARVRIETDTTVAVEADGQVVGQTPAAISVLRRGLRVLRGDGPPQR